MSSVSFKYIFIGNLNSKKQIIDYPSNVNESIVNNCSKIFDGYCNNKIYLYDERTRINSNQGTYYFTILASNIFYCALVDNTYPERNVFNLIDELEKNMIYKKINENGEISLEGRNQFNKILAMIKTTSALERAQESVNELKPQLRKEIMKVIGNNSELTELDIKADKIVKAAEDMKEGSKKLKFCAWLRNFKWTLIIISIVIGVLLIIIVPVVLTEVQKAKDNEVGLIGSNTNTNTNTTNIIFTKP